MNIATSAFLSFPFALDIFITSLWICTFSSEVNLLFTAYRWVLFVSFLFSQPPYVFWMNEVFSPLIFKVIPNGYILTTLTCFLLVVVSILFYFFFFLLLVSSLVVWWFPLVVCLYSFLYSFAYLLQISDLLLPGCSYSWLITVST